MIFITMPCHLICFFWKNAMPFHLSSNINKRIWIKLLIEIWFGGLILSRYKGIKKVKRNNNSSWGVFDSNYSSKLVGGNMKYLFCFVCGEWNLKRSGDVSYPNSILSINFFKSQFFPVTALLFPSTPSPPPVISLQPISHFFLP